MLVLSGRVEEIRYAKSLGEKVGLGFRVLWLQGDCGSWRSGVGVEVSGGTIAAFWVQSSEPTNILDVDLATHRALEALKGLKGLS